MSNIILISEEHVSFVQAICQFLIVTSAIYEYLIKYNNKNTTISYLHTYIIRLWGLTSEK